MFCKEFPKTKHDVKVRTLHFDAGGGGRLAVHVDRLAGVDTRVSGPQAGDVQSDQAEVKGSLNTGA